MLQGAAILSRKTHIVDFDDARAYRADYSARAHARVAASQRLARRQQNQESHRRARDAREAGIRRGSSQPILGRSRRRGTASVRPGRNYSSQWDIEDSIGFDTYGENAYDPKLDNADDEDQELEEVVIQESWLKRFQRNNRKRRAQRESARAIEAASKPDEDAPRAALYEMKMGSKHRGAVKAQAATSRSSGRLARVAALPAQGITLPGKVLRIIGGVVLTLALIAAFLYPAAKNYYVALRDYDKAAIAVQVAQERNALLEQDVEALSTPEGLEDRVRSEYGWVKEGENAVAVVGVSDSNDGIKRLEELPTVETVTAPETWYSPVLDRVFGYEG